MTAIVTKIISNSPRDVVVKIVGTGTFTITLASLVSATQIVVGTPVVNIVSCFASIPGSSSGSVTRNGETVFFMHSNFAFQPVGPISTVIDENSTSDITINLTEDATVIIGLRKMYGYSGI